MGAKLRQSLTNIRPLAAQIATHNKPYFAAAQGTWDVLQDVSAVLDDNLLGTTPCPVVEVCRVSCA